MPIFLRDREPGDFDNNNTPRAHYEIRHDSLNPDKATPKGVVLRRSQFIDIGREPRLWHGVNGGSRYSSTERVTLTPRTLTQIGVESFLLEDHQGDQKSLSIETEIAVVFNESRNTITIDPQDPDEPDQARTFDPRIFRSSGFVPRQPKAENSQQ